MLTLLSVWVLTPQYSDGDTILSKEYRLSDETLIRGPGSLWSLKNPMALLVKSRGVTPGVLANFPPLALVNHGLPIIPIHLIGSISLSSPPVAGVW